MIPEMSHGMLLLECPQTAMVSHLSEHPMGSGYLKNQDLENDLKDFTAGPDILEDLQHGCILKLNEFQTLIARSKVHIFNEITHTSWITFDFPKDGFFRGLACGLTRKRTNQKLLSLCNSSATS